MTYNYDVIILFTIGKTNSVVSQIKFCVIAANEDIAQNPQWAVWWWNVNTHKTRYTQGLSKLRNLESKKCIYKINNNKHRIYIIQGKLRHEVILEEYVS